MVVVEQIWTGNSARNFNYLLGCSQTGEAVAIDPLDHDKILDRATLKGWKITQVLNTHEHWDHIGGNKRVIEATGATVLAHANAAVPGKSVDLHHGDKIKIGSSGSLTCLDTPGHTMAHICFSLEGGHNPALFSGDTLFNAGVGNCHNGGFPEALYESFATHLSLVPDDVLIYPGHDYLENNLLFTLDREPSNEAAKELLNQVKQTEPGEVVTSFGLEKKINVFLRLQEPEVIAGLQDSDDSRPLDSKEVFLKLRALRNHW